MKNLCLKNSFVLISLLLFSACSLLPSSSDMPELYRLSSLEGKGGFKNCKIAKKVFIDSFNVDAMLETSRVPTLDKRQHVRYIKGVAWVDRPAILLREGLKASFQARMSNCIILVDHSFSRDNDYRLHIALQELTYLRDRQEVWLRADIQFFDSANGKLLKQIIFDQKKALDEPRISKIMQGFNALAQRFFAEIIQGFNEISRK